VSVGDCNGADDKYCKYFRGKLQHMEVKNGRYTEFEMFVITDGWKIKDYNYRWRENQRNPHR
jgi:hypothetical protein